MVDVNINADLAGVFDEVRGALITSTKDLYLLAPAGPGAVGFVLIAHLTKGWIYQDAGANQPASIRIVQGEDPAATPANLDLTRLIAFKPEGDTDFRVFIAPPEDVDVPQIGVAQVWTYGVTATGNPYVPA